MDKPTLGIPILSKMKKIPSMTLPNNLAIGPMIIPSSGVKIIPDKSFPPN